MKYLVDARGKSLENNHYIVIEAIRAIVNAFHIYHVLIRSLLCPSIEFSFFDLFDGGEQQPTHCRATPRLIWVFSAVVFLLIQFKPFIDTIGIRLTKDSGRPK